MKVEMADPVIGARANADHYIRALGDGIGDLKTCIAGIQRVLDERKMCGPDADMLLGQLVREALAAEERRPARRRGNPRPKWMRPFIRKLMLNIVRPQKKLTKEWRDENIREAMANPECVRPVSDYRKLYKRYEIVEQPKGRKRADPKFKYLPSPSEFKRALEFHPHLFAAYGIKSPLTIKSIFSDKGGRDSRRKVRVKK